MKKSFRYIIIGAGPAGSAAAALLASAGEEVCIVEKKLFPREVLCGEFLSSEVTQFIEEMGLKENFNCLKPQRIKSFKFINSNGKVISSELPFPAYASKRSAFDNLLLEEAVRKGAFLYTPAEVKDIKSNGQGFNLDVSAGTEIITLSCETIIAAYGRHNSLDKKLGRAFSGIASGISGIKFHLHRSYLNDPAAQEIQIYAADGIYCGINPVSESEYTVCFLNDTNRNSGNSMQQIKYLLKKNKKFSELFNTGLESLPEVLKFYGTANLYFGEREKYVNGIYFIGDSSGIIAPLAGDGIGMALQSARLLADHLLTGENPSAYGPRWNKVFSPRLRTAKMIQSILLNPALRNASVFTANLFPPLLKYLIHKTRSV